MDASHITEVTATGDVTTATSHLRFVTLKAPAGLAASATLELRAGGSSGTKVLSINADAGMTTPVGPIPDALMAGGIHATISGTDATATIVYA